MKAVICTQYGKPEVLQVKEVKKPIPKDNEVLIKIYATTAHIGDTRIRRVDPFLVRLVFGLFKPKKNLILGLEISGIIENVGINVKSFKKGDKVYALTGFGLGGYAEYRCLPEKVKDGMQQRKGLVALKPENLTYEEAAAIPAGGLTALKNLQKANIGKGQNILINGASGSLGTYAIQLAKFYGAEVTAVCSAKNFDLVKSIGADKLIDYSKEDFTKQQDKYDIIYDAVMKLKASKCRKILKSNGIFLNNSRLPKIRNDDLLFLKYLIENNKLKPVIDRTYFIEEIIEAHRYVDKGHKKGNVAVRIYDTYLTNNISVWVTIPLKVFEYMYAWKFEVKQAYPGNIYKLLFVSGDAGNGRLDLILDNFWKWVVGQVFPDSPVVVYLVEPEKNCISRIAKVGEPPEIGRDGIENIAVGHIIPFVPALNNMDPEDLDVSKGSANL